MNEKIPSRQPGLHSALTSACTHWAPVIPDKDEVLDSANPDEDSLATVLDTASVRPIEPADSADDE